MSSNLYPIFGNNQAFPEVFMRVVEKLELIQRRSTKNENKTIRKEERDSRTPRRSDDSKEDNELELVIKPSPVLGTRINE